MSAPGNARPGAGFTLLLLTVLGALAFFCWGLRTPPLDDVWRMQIELNLGQGGVLSDRGFRVIQEALVRHPELAQTMLEDGDAGLISANSGGVVSTGFAYLVRRRAEESGRLVVTGIGDEGVEVAARTVRASTAGMVDERGALDWRLPNDGPFPQLVEIRIGSEEQVPAKRREKVPEATGGNASHETPAVLVRLVP